MDTDQRKARRGLFAATVGCAAVALVCLYVSVASDSPARALIGLGGACFLGLAVWAGYLSSKVPPMLDGSDDAH